jgi:ABC-type antimicrobial peptide transport system permease subunit
MNMFNGSELEDMEVYIQDYCTEHNTTGEVYPLAINFLESADSSSDDMFVLFGIDPVKGIKYDFITFNSETANLQGQFLSPGGGAQILLGNKVWKTNFPGTQVGDEISLDTLSFSTGSMATIDNVTIAGILEPNIIYDSFAVVPIEYLLEETGLYDPLTGEYQYFFVSVWVEDASLIDFAEVKTGLKGITGISDRDISDNENYIKQTIMAHQTEIAEQEEMRRTIDGWLLAVILLLSIITVVGISNTMLMSVTERRREIGTLKAVGVSKARIYQIVLGEALLLALASLIIGGGAGMILSEFFDIQYQAEAGGIFFAPTSLTLFVVLYVTGISMGVSILAALYPAWRAARLEPTEALRYE